MVGECAALDADVLVMQESWTPAGGLPSTAARVADSLGYQRVEQAMAHGRLYEPDPNADRRWGPSGRNGGRNTLRLDGERRHPAESGPHSRHFSLGTYSLAVLTRVPFTEVGVLDLGKLRRDPATRKVITGVVQVGNHRLTILGTHMSHLFHPSIVQYLRLRSAVASLRTPAVLTGDMNLWGPPLSLLIPGWRRPVRGRTWPAWRPHSQVDHVLITPTVTVTDARVIATTGSDHRPVSVTLTVG